VSSTVIIVGMSAFYQLVCTTTLFIGKTAMTVA